MSNNFKLLTWMVPVAFEDGHGFRTIVSPQDGYYVLISEMHRRGTDETLCFPCDSSGELIRFTEIASGWDTADALEDLKRSWVRMAPSGRSVVTPTAGMQPSAGRGITGK